MTRVVALVLGLLAGATRVCADGSTNVTCLESYKWAENAVGQSPCLVAAMLIAAPPCGDNDYFISTLTPSSQYTSSSSALACVCNDVVYSLFAACADCQGRGIEKWSEWIRGCPKTYSNYQGCVPPNTDIPGWAQLNIQITGEYSPAAARAFANQLASASASFSSSAWAASSASLASSTSTVSVLSSTSALSVTPTAAHSASSSGSEFGEKVAGSSGGGSGQKNHAGTIAGTMIGGLAVLIIFVLKRTPHASNNSRGPAFHATSTFIPSSDDELRRLAACRPQISLQDWAARYHIPAPILASLETNGFSGPHAIVWISDKVLLNEMNIQIGWIGVVRDGVLRWLLDNPGKEEDGAEHIKTLGRREPGDNGVEKDQDSK